jgi:putative selenium metabolism hydrolase
MFEKIFKEAEKNERQIKTFLRDLIAIRSMSGEEEEAIYRVKEEMERVGYDEIDIDPMGNILGRIGKGEHIIALDAHVDTVDVGNPANWEMDPFKGAEKDGIIYGRGSCDMKGALASIVYGGKIIKDLGLEDDFSLYVVGSVQEEDCDGLCWHYIIQEGILRPEIVVIAEPTNLGLYRGQRGRMEMEICTEGISCHGSAPARGINAIYKIAPIIQDIEQLNEQLGGEPFLGKGTITISHIRSTSPSLCAVADSATIHIDRRLAATDTLESAVGQLEELPGVKKAGGKVTVLEYTVPSWRGLTYPMKKYYPTWLIPEDHNTMISGKETFEKVLGERPRIGRWDFSTNGVSIMGLHNIPCIGFGPGNEYYAHMANEHVQVEDLVKAAAWYAGFPLVYGNHGK